MTQALFAIQIAGGLVLVVVVLLQAKGGGLGSLMGGSDGSNFRTRRGLERVLFRFTIVWGTLFVLLTMVTARIAAAPSA